MILSPLSAACVVGGATQAIRRTDLSPGLLRLEARLGTAACVTMAVFLTGCGWWIAGRGQGPGNLFHAGAIDVAGVAVMTSALAVAQQAAHQARRRSAHQDRPGTGAGGAAR